MNPNPYGTTKASRVMLSQDREKDVLSALLSHLTDYPLPDPFDQFETLRLLTTLNRRSR